MGIGPLALLIIAVGTIGFEALVFGQDLVESSIIPTIETPTCPDTLGVFETMACWIKVVGIGIVNTFIVVISVIRFFFSALTFNVPGANIYVRIMFSTVMVGGIGLAIAGLFRGTKVA